MKCPKCQEGEIQKIIFTEIQHEAYSCDICDELWFSDETIYSNKDRTLHSFSKDNELDYFVEKIKNKKQDNKSSGYSLN